MLTIEYVRLRGSDDTAIVGLVSSGDPDVVKAEAVAASLLHLLRAHPRKTLADGFQIKNRQGDVLHRSWDGEFSQQMPKPRIELVSVTKAAG